MAFPSTIRRPSSIQLLDAATVMMTVAGGGSTLRPQAEFWWYGELVREACRGVPHSNRHKFKNHSLLPNINRIQIEVVSRCETKAVKIKNGKVCSYLSDVETS